MTSAVDVCPNCGRGRLNGWCKVCRKRDDSAGTASRPPTATGGGSTAGRPRPRPRSTPPVTTPPASSPTPPAPVPAASAFAGGDPRRRATPASPAASGGDSGRPPYSGHIDSVGAPRSEAWNMRVPNAMSSLGSGLFMAIPKALMLVAGILFAPLRFLMGAAVLRGNGGGSRPDEIRVTVHPFRVRLPSGRVVECVLRGDMIGGDLAVGDKVTVYGRKLRRAGTTIDVQRIVNAGTGNEIRPRLPSAARGALVGSILKLMAALTFLYVVAAACGLV